MRRRRLVTSCLMGAVSLSLGLGQTACGIVLPDPAVRYVAFGDSATAGPDQPGYPEQLADRLGDRDLVANAGMGGESIAEGINRLELLVRFGIYPNAVGLLYWEGGNDVAEFIRANDPLLTRSPADEDYPFADALGALLDEVQANIERAVEIGQQAGWTVSLMTYYPFAAGVSPCPMLPAGVISADQAVRGDAYVALLNDRIRRAADRGKAGLIAVDELGDILRADGANYFNCNHLSASGNAVVADLVAGAVSSQAERGEAGQEAAGPTNGDAAKARTSGP